MEPQLAEQFGRSFVRISTENRVVVGAGFLISERHVLTCAHVVAGALGNYELEAMIEKPQGTVHLDFPFLGAAAHTASVVDGGWQPRTGPSTNPSGDIA